MCVCVCVCVCVCMCVPPSLYTHNSQQDAKKKLKKAIGKGGAKTVIKSNTKVKAKDKKPEAKKGLCFICPAKKKR